MSVSSTNAYRFRHNPEKPMLETKHQDHARYLAGGGKLSFDEWTRSNQEPWYPKTKHTEAGSQVNCPCCDGKGERRDAVKDWIIRPCLGCNGSGKIILK